MATTRAARVVWEGDLLEGSGQVWTESSQVLVGMPVTWASRADEPQGRTSPEELLAAAHAACFSMALANELAKAGHPAERLDVRATASFEKTDGGWRVTTMRLEVTGRVPGADEAGFGRAAEAASVGCPISRALEGNVRIELSAKLEG
ncbi:MAG TPA: OsmC family peroxiredoxin [Actinomycetota bacterium]|nr:OsmC family peroxiredoxin [Actinomycetota bacterium]